MLDMSPVTKAIFARLERATAAVQSEHIAQGREQNPRSTVHWTMENHGAGYKITMMRGGVIIAQKALDRADVTALDAKGNRIAAPQETIDAICASMFEKVPVEKTPKAA